MIDLRAGVTNESTPWTTPTAVMHTNTRREEVERSDRPVTYSDQLKSHVKPMHDNIILLYWGTATDWSQKAIFYPTITGWKVRKGESGSIPKCKKIWASD